MPTYDYQCDACGHRFEKFQSITARPVRKCPRCGESGARRLIGTGAGVIFKGSGFYQTDYRSDSYRKAAEKESQAPADGKKAEAKDGPSAKASKSGEGGTSTSKGGGEG